MAEVELARSESRAAVIMLSLLTMKPTNLEPLPRNRAERRNIARSTRIHGRIVPRVWEEPTGDDSGILDAIEALG